MSGESTQTTPSADVPDAKGDHKLADTIDKDDPHKVEKLANAGRDTDVAEASE